MRTSRNIQPFGGDARQPPFGVAAICHEPEGSATVGGDGIIGRDLGAAEEADARRAERILSGDGDVDRQIGADEAAVAIQVDRRR